MMNVPWTWRSMTVCITSLLFQKISLLTYFPSMIHNNITVTYFVMFEFFLLLCLYLLKEMNLLFLIKKTTKRESRKLNKIKIHYAHVQDVKFTISGFENVVYISFFFAYVEFIDFLCYAIIVLSHYQAVIIFLW